MADTVYHNIFLEMMDKHVNLGASGDIFYLALFTDVYTIDPDEVTYSTTDECPETGNYTHGGYGFTNTNNSVTDDDANNRTIFDIAEDAEWDTATITAHYAKLYDSSYNNRLVCVFDFGANKSSTAGTFKVKFNATGVMTLS